MQRIEPGRTGQRFAPILAGLEEVAAGIAAAEDAEQTSAHERFVAEFRRVPPMAAVMAQQPEGWLEKRFVHIQVSPGCFHVTRV